MYIAIYIYIYIYIYIHINKLSSARIQCASFMKTKDTKAKDRSWNLEKIRLIGKEDRSWRLEQVRLFVLNIVHFFQNRQFFIKKGD